MPDAKNDVLPPFTEHRVDRGVGSVYVRDFQGSGPAFVVLHGFPDNSHIYDALIPYLSAAGRRVVAVDFLGFGASDSLLTQTIASRSSSAIWKPSPKHCTWIKSFP
jgi:pimeloyl-ACP methyl ester carboxylesterase